MNNLYELKSNKFGSYFIKNNQYWYLDQLEVFGLDTSLRYDTIEYNFYKVEFIEKDNKKYIKCRKTKAPYKKMRKE